MDLQMSANLLMERGGIRPRDAYRSDVISHQVTHLFRCPAEESRSLQIRK